MTNWEAWLAYNSQSDNIFLVLGLVAVVLVGLGWFLLNRSKKWVWLFIKYCLALTGAAVMVVGALWIA